MASMRLYNVPAEIQQRYNIGSEVDVEADSSVGGGHFSFLNKDGRTVEVDAVEICGQGIEYQYI
jgi:hypothetical protein